MKKLPIGIQNLREIITDNCYYVDKTKYVYELVVRGKYYFLSRPRRFGKSLFVDTLKEAFWGNKELFKGLYLENNWDWSKKYPVIHINFGSGVDNSKDLLESIDNILEKHIEEYELEVSSKSYKLKFEELIIQLYKKYKERVVILIDEYDKPILDKIEEKEIANANREILRNFYSVIKANDAYLKFVFITGVTKFNKVSIFSGLNQLQDITLNSKYSAICGYTEGDIQEVFKDVISEVDLEEMRYWYNGYNWLGESVYNPYDVLLYLDEKDFKPYWFATGTPTFLMKLIKGNRYYLPEIENIKITDSILDSFDIDNIGIENLLFQAGYLTIKEVNKSGGRNIYSLCYPNFEVKTAFNDHVVAYLTNTSVYGRISVKIEEMFSQGRIENLKEVLYAFFSSIPYEWYVNNEINKYEGYYASVLYALIASIGMEMRVEESTNKGKLDMMVSYNGKVYVMEFKVIKNDKEKGSALQQIKEKKYYEKYKETGKELYIIGIEFDEKERNVVNVEYEKMK